MGGAIIMLPESVPVAAPLVEYVYTKEGARALDLLILSKQKEGFGDILASYDFRRVYVLDEEYYGGIKSGASLAFMIDKARGLYDTCYFPFNTFRANAFLFGAIIAREAVAVNSSLLKVRDSVPEVVFSLDKGEMRASRVPWADELDTIRATLKNLVSTLSTMDSGFKVSGERPNLGILEGFGHDLEILMKYAYGIGEARGRKVLDIGGGLGYGSYLLSKFAEEVVFLDRSAETAEFVRKTWAPLAPNLRAVCGEASDMRDKEGYFDTVFLMDVIEHVEKPMRLLKEVKSLLRPGGVLVLSTPEEDYYPYRVCPEERRGEDHDTLLSEAIWPWHIQGLGEGIMLPMLKGSGFDVMEKSYTTYIKGYELKKRLAEAKDGRSASALASAAGDITTWDIEDFAITLKRDPFFSAASYNVVARKEARCP